MNIQPTNNQPVSDDNDLAKVLSGADGQVPAPPPPAAPVTDQMVAPDAEPTVEDQLPIPEEPELATPPPEENPDQMVENLMNDQNPQEEVPPQADEELEGIKKQALEELKPLVDKLELPAEEKFDILLLVVRSTDDKELVAKAHAAAVEITDESRKAQALLDIIKEVDYFSGK